MRAKTLFLIMIITAYGYYLHAMSGAVQRRADGLMHQYRAALTAVGEVPGFSTSNNLVVQQSQAINR
jgi:hypothetical protein